MDIGREEEKREPARKGVRVVAESDNRNRPQHLVVGSLEAQPLLP